MGIHIFELAKSWATEVEHHVYEYLLYFAREAFPDVWAIECNAFAYSHIEIAFKTLDDSLN